MTEQAEHPSIPLQTVPSDGPQQLRETLDTINQYCFELGRTILEHCIETNTWYDGIVVPPRGGLFPANVVSRLLGIGSTDIIAYAISSYHDGDTDQQSFRFGQLPTEAHIAQGGRYLVVDEVCDTGRTLRHITHDLTELGAAAVDSAVVHYKPHKSETGFVPTWHVVETDAWIVYPWENYEAIGNEVKRLRTSGEINTDAGREVLMAMLDAHDQRSKAAA